MDFIKEELFKLKNESFALFESKIIKGFNKAKFIGVKVPKIRKLSKKLENSQIINDFLKLLPHKYHDENILHAVLISENRFYTKTLKLLKLFLPYVNNWAVCDTIRPKSFKNNTDALLPSVEKWLASKMPYVCRFGINMLIVHYLNKNKFNSKYLKLPLKIQSNEYYVNMAIAWFYSVALAEHWDRTIPYIENKVLSPWVHNKTIQKARESFRISKEQKEYLNTLKV